MANATTISPAMMADPASERIKRLKDYFDYVRDMLFGLLIILFIIWEPEGLNKLWLRGRAALGRLLSSATAQRTSRGGGEATEST